MLSYVRCHCAIWKVSRLGLQESQWHMLSDPISRDIAILSLRHPISRDTFPKGPKIEKFILGWNFQSVWWAMLRGSLRGVWIKGALNARFRNPGFRNPCFRIPWLWNPCLRESPSVGFPHLRNPCFRNPWLRNPWFRNSHLRNFSRIQAPLNQTPLRLPPRCAWNFQSRLKMSIPEGDLDFFQSLGP